jgi:LacI family transcriptional regulator
MTDGRQNGLGSRAATIKDVALEAGVSPMTVSRVVNAKGNVRPETVDKIQKAIAKVGYRPNIGARRLSSGRTYQFLMVFNNPNVAWTAEILIGTMHACHEVGYHLLIEGVGDYEGESIGAPIDYEELENLIDVSRVDGVILPPPICFDRQLLDIVRKKNVPCVRVAGAPVRDIRLRVGIDNYAAAYDMTDHLISLGHENIAIIKGPENFAASTLRFEGFMSAMREHNLKFRESNIRYGRFDVESGHECARQLLQQEDRPTAIFATNDEMAAGTLAAAQEMKIRVPGELSVAGFDDAPIAHSVWPGLTTVRQPLRLIGAKSVELLESYIRQADAGSRETVRPDVLLDYELKIRQSTAPPPDMDN